MIWSKVVNFFVDWKVKVAIIAIVLSSLFFWHKAEVRVAVNAKEQEITQQIARENFKLAEKSQAATKAIKDTFTLAQKDKDEKIKALTTRVSVLTSSLQSRPNRPEPSRVPTDSSHSESQPGATGSGLYRDDGQFLVWYAESAERLKVELKGCYRNYDDVKAILDKYRADNSPGTN